jgi:hypothetical protein
MAHNPYANAYPVGGKPWTAEEDEILLNGRKANKGYEDMRSMLPGRSIGAMKARRTHLCRSAEQRLAIQHRHKIARRTGPLQNHTVEPPVIVPPEVLAERERRFAVPKSLTAMIMGDPESNRVRL